MFITPQRGRRDAAGILPAVGALVTVAAYLALVTGLLTASAPPAVAGEEPPTVRMHGATGGEEAEEENHGDGQTLHVEARAVDYPEPAPEPPPGEAIVSLAMAYLGYPYVAAGNTPAGFDCSGFTQWVILNTLGIDVGHALTGQPGMGAWVDWGAWRPGDLVFFQNTYQAGLSHVGIYVGDGLFIHAENEGTGVTLSSIYSEYYGPRYWGAVRVA